LFHKKGVCCKSCRYLKKIKSHPFVGLSFADAGAEWTEEVPPVPDSGAHDATIHGSIRRALRKSAQRFPPVRCATVPGGPFPPKPFFKRSDSGNKIYE